jgi:hypothetical protein
MTVHGEVLFEFAPRGGSMRVTAFHVDTLTEIVLQAPSRMSHYHMEKLALRKLNYVLNRRRAVAVRTVPRDGTLAIV